MLWDSSWRSGVNSRCESEMNIFESKMRLYLYINLRQLCYLSIHFFFSEMTLSHIPMLCLRKESSGAPTLACKTVGRYVLKFSQTKIKKPNTVSQFFQVPNRIGKFFISKLNNYKNFAMVSFMFKNYHAFHFIYVNAFKSVEITKKKASD